MINHNIRRTIMFKVAFNQWKDKLKTIHEEYLSIFYVKDDFILNTYCRCNCGVKGHLSCNYRITQYYYSKNIFKLMDNTEICELPKKYFYSSGLNYPNGYKI